MYKKMTPIALRIILHTMLRLGKIAVPNWKIAPSNPFLEDSFIKVGTDIAYSEEVGAFVNSLPEVGQNSIKNKEFVDTRLIRCKKRVSDTTTKNKFVNSCQVNKYMKKEVSCLPFCSCSVLQQKKHCWIVYLYICRGVFRAQSNIYD